MPHASSDHVHWDQRDGRVAAVAAAIVFSFWVVEVVLPGVGAAQGVLADLDSPFGRFLDDAHRIASILVLLAAGLGLSLGARWSRRWLTVSWASMAVFGAASLTASLLPGPCVVSTDVACAAESLAEGLAGATVAQAVVAVVAMLAGLLGVVSLAVSLRLHGMRSWLPVAVVAAAQTVAVVAVLVLSGLLLAADGSGAPGVTLGLLERAHLVTVALWLLCAGVLPGPWKRVPHSGLTSTPRRPV
ncbi:hypothetical protein DFP74_1393 [Nocardiopsis sp. Huas11]|uniref:DUF998 domain-containing protein n=1 Tax=Nocardiopsis sp. Huas11 TaxID=2183912 RepID=UPI000EB50AE1|nr:DUF998 domain-containing protein [Nocardiopsis sp. Huas11]RKS05781.1 hypothetical protein DFP74_1393 [Nocardiopsis sp. Huas11]